MSALTAVAAVGLLALGWSLIRRRQSAGHAAVVGLAALAAVELVRGVDTADVAAALAVAAVLRVALRVAARGAEPPRTASAAALAVGALAAGYAVAFSALELSGRGLGLWAGLARAAAALGSSAARLPVPDAGTAVHVLAALAALGSVGLVRAVLAPQPFREGHGSGEHARAAAVVAAHGEDSIAPFVLRSDTAFFFAHGGVLAYRTLCETAVVSGDPVGPPGAAPAILAAFLAFARRNGWEVVMMAARDEHLPAYRALGLRSVRVGAEAIVDPRAFRLAGRAGRTVRKAVNRLERRGWTVDVARAGELTGAQQAGIAAVEREWRARRPRLYGSAMALDRLWGAQEDASDVYVLARAPSGEVRAFQRYLRYRGGLSLDAMRRLDDDPNGVSDALVAAALAHARALGCHEVSLNFSAFAHLTSGPPPTRPAERLARWALRRLRRRFQLERLVRFAGKFGPQWRTRHLVYQRRSRLPLSALRVMQAEAYVRPPRRRTRQNAWQPRPLPPGGTVARGTTG